MKLSEVYSSGATGAQGFIKCTFAELYNMEGKKVFSLNKHQVGYNVAVVTNATPNAGGYVEVAVTDKVAQDVINVINNAKHRGSGYKQLTSGDSILVKESAIEWQPIEEKNIPDDEPNKMALYIGLGLLALSLLK